MWAAQAGAMGPSGDHLRAPDSCPAPRTCWWIRGPERWLARPEAAPASHMWGRAKQPQAIASQQSMQASGRAACQATCAPVLLLSPTAHQRLERNGNRQLHPLRLAALQRRAQRHAGMTVGCARYATQLQAQGCRHGSHLAHVCTGTATQGGAGPARQAGSICKYCAHRELHPRLVQHRLLQAQAVHQGWQVAPLTPTLRRPGAGRQRCDRQAGQASGSAHEGERVYCAVAANGTQGRRPAPEWHGAGQSTAARLMQPSPARTCALNCWSV